MARDTVTYAIGDIHGEAERLRRLHGLVFRHQENNFSEARLRIIHLGDYVDRGSDSCGVIETILELEARSDCEVINLKGNHEEMLLRALRGETDSVMQMWLLNGGEETLASYRKRGLDTVLEEHVVWIEDLPTIYCDTENKTIYVHAGIDVNAFPNCRESVRLWTRSDAFFETDSWDNDALTGWRVIHGHTPTEDFFPEVDGEHGSRINLDTGAVFGGRLTAAVFAPGRAEKFIYV